MRGPAKLAGHLTQLVIFDAFAFIQYISKCDNVITLDRELVWQIIKSSPAEPSSNLVKSG